MTVEVPGLASAVERWRELHVSPSAKVKPSIFIGSSTRGLAIAFAIQRELSGLASATVWSQGAYPPTRAPIESLFAALEEFDFAVFVFLAEDPGIMGDRDVLFVRDNVIFEAGLFLA